MKVACKYCQKPVSRLQPKPWGSAHIRCYTRAYNMRKLAKQDTILDRLYDDWMEAGGKPEEL